MAEAHTSGPVSVSRRSAIETARHPSYRRDATETAGETPSLKALAQLVLARDTARDILRDGVSHSADTNEASIETLPIPDAPSCTPRVAETAGRDTPELRRHSFAINQLVTGVSLSHSLETETPETAIASWADGEEERAAIVEHDGSVPREWAEGFARLDNSHPPGDVPPKRWRQFIDDVGLFLDSSFVAVAAALGWGPHDLFGCDRDRPFARLDQAGLLWLVNGDQLVMLANDVAAIETRTGARQTYRRRPTEPDRRVLAWELFA